MPNNAKNNDCKFYFRLFVLLSLQSCYSPASSGSVISVSTNRSVNIKESKEKKNRERLLAGPGSEFSLAPEDMEMDYYDYNIHHAQAAPGSYLGMDPAYLVWIPPLDGNDDYSKHTDSNDSNASTHSDDEPHYDEISPTYDCSTSNRIYEQPPELPPMKNSKSISSDSNEYIEEKCKNADLNRVLIANAFTAIDDDVDDIAGVRQKIGKNLLSRKKVPDAIPMTELRSKKSTDRTQSYQNQPEQRCSYASTTSNDDKDIGTEKETAVVKSSSKNFHNYYELDDIQFADDDSDDNRSECDYATAKT